MEKTKIKVILWDIDGTLLDFEAAEKIAIQKCFAKFDMGECTDSMLASYKEINREYWKKLERGELCKCEVLEGRFQTFFEIYGLDVSIVPDFNKEYQLRLGDTVRFHKHGLETVQACKEKVLQYAVTNGTKLAQDRKLRNSGLLDLLDGVFISDVVGFEKPSLQFFEQVFQTIGAYSKSEILIIGDSLTSDIQGGNNAGISTCWFNPTGRMLDLPVRVDYEIKDLSRVLELI